LSENKEVQVGKVVLVAPSLGLDWDHKGMYDFKLDPEIVKRTAGITILVADDDREGIQRAVTKISTTARGVKVRRLKTGGHFTFKETGKREFPELLAELL
jgi:hypothetical protein